MVHVTGVARRCTGASLCWLLGWQSRCRDSDACWVPSSLPTATNRRPWLAITVPHPTNPSSSHPACPQWRTCRSSLRRMQRPVQQLQPPPPQQGGTWRGPPKRSSSTRWAGYRWQGGDGACTGPWQIVAAGRLQKQTSPLHVSPTAGHVGYGVWVWPQRPAARHPRVLKGRRHRTGKEGGMDTGSKRLFHLAHPLPLVGLLWLRLGC